MILSYIHLKYENCTKTTTKTQGQDTVSSEEHFSCMRETLGSILSTAKETKKQTTKTNTPPSRSYLFWFSDLTHRCSQLTSGSALKE